MSDAPLILRQIDDYLARLFAPPDEALGEALRAAQAAGLPRISISPTEGRLISILVGLVGARRALEVGTLAGYSAIWIARALQPGGRLVTIEIDPERASIARGVLAAAGLADRVEVRVGSALELLAAMPSGADPAPFDVAFLDAARPSYPALLAECVRLVRPGGLILADNVLRDGAVLAPTDPETAAVARFNELLATDPGIEAIAVPFARDGVDGLSIARVRPRS